MVVSKLTNNVTTTTLLLLHTYIHHLSYNKIKKK